MWLLTPACQRRNPETEHVEELLQPSDKSGAQLVLSTIDPPAYN